MKKIIGYTIVILILITQNSHAKTPSIDLEFLKKEVKTCGVKLITDSKTRPQGAEPLPDSNFYLLKATGCDGGDSTHTLVYTEFPKDAELDHSDMYLLTRDGKISLLEGHLDFHVIAETNVDSYSTIWGVLKKADPSLQGDWVLVGKDLKEKLESIKFEEFRSNWKKVKNNPCKNLAKEKYNNFRTAHSKALNANFYDMNVKCKDLGNQEEHLISKGEILKNSECKERVSGTERCDYGPSSDSPIFALKIGEKKWLMYMNSSDAMGEDINTHFVSYPEK